MFSKIGLRSYNIPAMNSLSKRTMVITAGKKWAADPMKTPDHGPVIDETAEPRFLEMVKLHFDKAAKLTNVTPDLLSFIKECNTMIRFNIPLQRDDGSLEILTCYRAQHSHHKLPVKGGTRYEDIKRF